MDERPYLIPGGSGGEESPEYLRALEVYEERMAAFDYWVASDRQPRRRRAFSEYTAKNCEEASGSKAR